jgi:hypothetical protein
MRYPLSVGALGLLIGLASGQEETRPGGMPFKPPEGCCATAAMLRFQCSQLVIERLDPLVTPGMVVSHLQPCTATPSRL